MIPHTCHNYGASWTVSMRTDVKFSMILNNAVTVRPCGVIRGRGDKYITSRDLKLPCIGAYVYTSVQAVSLSCHPAFNYSF